MLKRKRKRGQVWISFVIYTLISLAAIGILLGVSRPKIAEIKDGITIKQTIEVLNGVDSSFRATLVAAGNVRTPELTLTRGELIVDPSDDFIRWSMDSAKEFSELGQEIQEGSITILTEEGGLYKVSLTLGYSEIADIVTENNEVLRVTKSSSPYTVIIKNLGTSDIGMLQKVKVSVEG